MGVKSYQRHDNSNLGSCFVQGGEFPEVRHIHSCTMLHQQLSDLHILVVYIKG